MKEPVIRHIFTITFAQPVLLGTLSGVLAAGGLAAAAQPAQATAGRTLLAAVVNAQGRARVDVGADDFVVTEGGQPREVLDVHVADYPLALVLDDRPESAALVDAIRIAARRFVERVGERPVALLRLSDATHPSVTLDDERSVLLERLDRFTASTSAGAPLDAVARAAAMLRDSGAPFSGVIVVAAGGVDASTLVRGELLPQIIDSGATVHVVETRAAGQPADGPDTPDLMRLVADQTHGQFTAIFSPVSYGAALDRLADRLAVELMIQYLVPPGPRTGDARVGVRVPGARVVGLGVK